MSRAATVVNQAAELKAPEADLAEHRVTSGALSRFVHGLDRKLDHEFHSMPSSRTECLPARRAGGRPRLPWSSSAPAGNSRPTTHGGIANGRLT